MKNPTEIQTSFLADREAAARSGLQQRGTMYLEDLPEQERFVLGGLRGAVVRVGFCGVMVQYDGRTEVEVAGKKFSRPLAPVQLAGRTEVTWEALS